MAVKPTYGVVSRYGVVAFGQLLDQVGPFARSVEDAALALNALSAATSWTARASRARRGLHAANLAEGARSMKIGIVPAFMEGGRSCARGAGRGGKRPRLFFQVWARNWEVELPHAQAAMSAYYVLGPCEAFRQPRPLRLGALRLRPGPPIWPPVRGQPREVRPRAPAASLGSYLLSAGVCDKYYYPASRCAPSSRATTRRPSKVDVILSPVAPTTAFKIGEICDPTEMYLADMFTISINIAGNGGAISSPVGLGADTRALRWVCRSSRLPSRTEHVPGGGAGAALRPGARCPISPTKEDWVRK